MEVGNPLFKLLKKCKSCQGKSRYLYEILTTHVMLTDLLDVCPDKSSIINMKNIYYLILVSLA